MDGDDATGDHLDGTARQQTVRQDNSAVVKEEWIHGKKKPRPKAGVLIITFSLNGGRGIP